MLAPRKRMTPVKRLLVAVLVGGLVLAGCGGSSKPVSPPAKQYLAIIAPANQAIDVFNADLRALPSSTTAAYVKITVPLAAAFNAARQKLLHVSWPAHTLPDIQGLAGAISVVGTDLADVATVNAVTFSAWESQLLKDLHKILGQAGLVRGDLGLPSQ
jgi:hypothetical protein